MLNPPAAIRRVIGGLILLTAVIALPWMAVQPQLAPPGQGGADKYLHLICFAGLAFVGLWTFRQLRTRSLVMLLLLALGAGIEGAQAMVPGRQGSLSDFAADAAGILAAVILLRCWPMARNVLSRGKD